MDINIVHSISALMTSIESRLIRLQAHIEHGSIALSFEKTWIVDISHFFFFVFVYRRLELKGGW